MTVISSKRNYVSCKRVSCIAASAMGCGHSKINIYPRKNKSKHSSSKKSVTPDKAESEEEDGVENESDNLENSEDCDLKKTIKNKPFGGLLLAQVDISTSQQDFFKMLDEKIQNGPDYNSESEIERMAENARVQALLRDWNAASLSPKSSMPSTPKKRIARGDQQRGGGDVPLQVRDASRLVNDVKSCTNYTQISQSVIHQSYGVSPLQQQQPPQQLKQQVTYRQVTYNNPNYIIQNPQNTPLPAAYPPSALQYQAISPLYNQASTYSPPPARQSHNQYSNPTNQYGSPVKVYSNSSVGGNMLKHQQPVQPVVYAPPPGHRMYGVPNVAKPIPVYSNGELMQQQYNQQFQYQQYKEARDQVLIQNQPPPQPGPYRQPPRGPYQTAVTIPIVVKSNDMNSVNRKQFEYT